MRKDKLLIIHHGALGDVVVIFPALLELKKNYRRIEILCRNEIGRLARTLHVVDQWFPLESAAFATLYSKPVDPAAKKILRSFSEIALFSRSRRFRKSLSAVMEKPVYRIPPRPDIDERIHVTDHIFGRLVKYGLLKKTEAGFTRLSSLVLKDQRTPQYKKTKILIHPGSGSPKKCWPVSNFIEIARFLEADGMRSEFILGPAEYDLAQILLQQKEFNGKVDKMDNLVEVSHRLKTGAAFIGNDSGITHLAAFLGLPTMAVFGPSDPVRWKPLGRSVKIIRPKLNCSPCFEMNNSICEAMECLNHTSPGDVLRAFYNTV